MFEDSLMESGGRIKTRSKWWSIAAFIANGSTLLVLILVPLIHPQALPKQALATLLVAPPPPAAQLKAQPVRSESMNSATMNRATMNSELSIPSVIPKNVLDLREVAPPPVLAANATGGIPGGSSSGIFDGVLDSMGNAPAPVVRAVITPKKIAVSAGVAAGNLLNRISPAYPRIAIAARIQGVVVVQATISKTGVIENAKAVSGPEMLKQAAIEGVRSARYKPYLLNGEPVAVETTVNVIFSLGG